MLNLKGIINVESGAEINPDSRYLVGSDFTSYSGQNFARDANVVHITGNESIGGNKRFSNNVRIDGTLTAVSTVMIISEVVAFSANYLTLNNNATGTPTENAGLVVNRGSSPKSEMIWNETLDRWTAGVSGSLDTVILKSDLSGAVTNASEWNHTTSIVNSGSPHWNSSFATVLASSGQWSLATSGGLSQIAFKSYSGQIAIDQHTQDLAITGKVSSATYIAGQHTQDLAITGKVSTDTYTSEQHTQDLAITGKVATGTYTVGQHTQDLAITGLQSQITAISGVFATGDDLEITYNPAGNVYTPVTANVSGHFAGINNYMKNLNNATSAFLTHDSFNSYSGAVNIAQHTQDLAITGKVSSATYVAGQHTQDLAITGKVSTDTYTIGQHTQDLAITGKVATGTYTVGQHTQDLALTGLRSDVNGLSANLISISGVFMAGDTIDINYVPSAGGYSAIAANISGHFSGVNNALANRVTLTDYDYIFIASEPTGGVYPGSRGQRYYNATSGVIYDCVTTNTWVRYFAAKIW